MWHIPRMFPLPMPADRKARRSTKMRPVRSDEEITAQLEARLAEMRREAALPVNAKRCRDCEFGKHAHCHNPLVKGFGAPAWQGSEATDICGPERALWRPRPTLRERLMRWLAE